MVNGMDLWTVTTVAELRRDDLLREAQRERAIRRALGSQAGGRGRALRRTVGRGIVRLGLLVAGPAYVPPSAGRPGNGHVAAA